MAAAKARQKAKHKRNGVIAAVATAGLLGIGALLQPGTAVSANPHSTAKAGVAGAVTQAAQNLLPEQIFVDPQTIAAQRILEARIKSLGTAFNGDVGIAVKDLQTGWTSDFDGATHFPQQSVSKFWVALTAFDKADKGQLNLTAPVRMSSSDITLFHQPIAAEIRAKGSVSTTLSSLLERALQQSDNTCNDFVLWKAGGPDAVRTFLASRGINGVRFGPGERNLQSEIAGMTWQASYAGRGFEAARAKLPMATRRAAFERYIANPIDGATPLGVVEALGKLSAGELLSPESTRRMIAIMSQTRTGAQRLKGGLAPGWSLAHKTGTGQVLSGEQAGYNDIGILTAPDGRSYAVAVLMRRTSAPLGERMALMQNVTRAVIGYSANSKQQTLASAGGTGIVASH